jgi:peroxiredoxin
MSKANVAKLLVLAAIVAGTIFLAIHFHRPGPLEVGDPAPDFTLAGLQGQTVSLGDHRQGVVVLNFWATWCPPCIEEMPSLERFAEAMRGKGIAVIGVSVDQDAAALEKFVAAAGLSFPIARDPNQTVAARYGTSKFPESYVIDLEGKIAEKIIGAVDWQDPRLMARVERLARRREPSAR